MTAIIASFLATAWPYLLTGIAGFILLLHQRRAGAKAERAKQAEREAKARDIADKIDGDVGALSPADARKELGKWSR